MKVQRRCAEQGASPMVGIPSRKTCTSPWEVRSSSPRMPPESSNTRRKRGAIQPGTPAQIADDIKRYAEVGVRHMMFPMVVRRPGVTVQQTLERMERFVTKVMPFV